MGDWRADLCRESYAIFQRLDAEAAVCLYHHDCEWDVGFAGAALGMTTYSGHAGVRKLIGDIGEVFPDWHPMIDELRLREDGALLVRSRVEATARDSRMPLEIPVMGQVIEFRDRRILRVSQTNFPPPGWEQAAELGE
jgi:ketosteroid isomerase-like protein